jgi:hypothetical protein
MHSTLRVASLLLVVVAAASPIARASDSAEIVRAEARAKAAEKRAAEAERRVRALEKQLRDKQSRKARQSNDEAEREASRQLDYSTMRQTIESLGRR